MASNQDESLETTGIEKPDIQKIIGELQQAYADSSAYQSRVVNSRAWWNCEWDGQSIDGRRWQPSGSKVPVFPWDGCSDSRLRIVSTIIQEHVILCLAAFWSSKKQAKSIRPFVSGKDVNVAQDMLDWRMNMMKRELLRELPMALSWKFGYGLSFIKVEWEQARELTYVPITMDMIAKITTQFGLGDVTEKILDPDKMYDKELVTVMQTLSPVLPTGEARTVLNQLRATGQSELPVADFRINKPKWTAKRPFMDITFPSETTDIQQTRFVNERELVSEVELTDRIITDGYDPDFVTEAIQHKGVFSDWQMQPGQIDGVQFGAQYLGSNRDLIELNHFLNWKIHNDTPCLYRTVFNSAVNTSQEGKDLCAVHRKFEYDHGQIPFIALRRGFTFRPLLSAVGIAEEAYTDEMDIKKQQDGLNDRTDLIHQPPMVVPTLRAQAVANNYGPRAVMTAMRPEGVVWPPLPPMDQTPVIVTEMVMQRLNRRYPLMQTPELDPTLVSLYRKQISNDLLGECELALEQTFQLQQQFETDEDVQHVSGGQSMHASQKDIQGQYTISATCDINNIDVERAKEKLGMIAQLLPFKEQGGMVFNMGARLVDNDLADALEQDQASPVAMEKEKSDEYNAIAQILSGIEAQKPMMAMNQLRLQTIQQIMMDPGTMQKVQGDPVAQKRLESRVKFFQAQIQQYQNNPQIGRTLTTQSLAPSQPAAVTTPQG